MSLFRLLPVPQRSNVLNRLNLFSEPWSKFFIRMFERLKILQNEVLILDVSRNEGTALTTGTGKFSMKMPFAFVLNDVRACVSTAPTGQALIIDLNEAGATILSTKLTIDAGETSSYTAAAAPVFSDFELAEDALLTIDIDQIGSGTAGAGLKVFLYGYRP